MSSKQILFLLGDYAEDYEVMVPFQALEMVGYDVHTICPDKEAGDQIVTAIHEVDDAQTFLERKGHHFTLNTTFEDLNPEDYDALVITGGRAPEYLRTYDEVIDLVHHFADSDKPIAAVCHGMQVLSAAGVIDDRTCTSYPPLQSEMENAGADWVDGVTVDGNLITARDYMDHSEWLAELLNVLGTEIIQEEEGIAASD